MPGRKIIFRSCEFKSKTVWLMLVNKKRKKFFFLFCFSVCFVCVCLCETTVI